MGVFSRKDSPWWWLWLEGAPTPRRRSKYLIGATSEDRKRSRHLAEREYFEAMLALSTSSAAKPEITFEKYADWYERHVIAHHRGKDREAQINGTLCQTFGAVKLHEITSDLVTEWRSRRAKDTSAATSNRELALLKAMLATAVPKYLEESPIAGLPLLRPPRRETAVLSPEHEAKLLAVLTPVDRAIVICAIDTLMRLSDVVNLQRRQDRGSYLVVEDPKIKPYRVPVSSRLRAALDGLPNDGPYYFPTRRYKKPTTTRSVLKNMLTRACAKAGINYGRALGGITFHGLRHTGATRMVEVGTSLRVVQEIGGWQSLRQLERYSHPTEAAKLAAVEGIGSRVTLAHEKEPTK